MNISSVYIERYNVYNKFFISKKSGGGWVPRSRIFYTQCIMDTLDLDIQHYTNSDLEQFFQLLPNRQYSISDVEYKESELREKYLNRAQVDPRFMANFKDFLTSAKNRLISAKQATVRPPTTIPTNVRTDPYFNTTPPSVFSTPRTDELVNHDDARFVFSQQSEFFRGDMNPLTTRIITKSVNIDTRFRDVTNNSNIVYANTSDTTNFNQICNPNNIQKTQSSDFIIKLPTTFKKVVSMELSSIEFPIEFYTISAAYGNNFLYMYVSYNDIVSGFDTTATRVFTIPDGYYTNQDLITAVNASLSAGGANSIFTYIQFTLDVNANGSGSRKVTVSRTGAQAAKVYNFTLDFTRDINGNTDLTDVSLKLGWNLGFVNFIYRGKVAYKADAVMDLSTFRYVYLAIDDYQKTGHNYFTNILGDSSIMSPDILARITTKGSVNDVAVNGDIRVVTEPRRYFGPVDIQRLRIRLLDAYGRQVPMSGANYSFCLTLKMVYDL